MRPDLSLPTLAAALAVLGVTACTRSAAPSAESRAITRDEPSAQATAPAPPPPPAQPTSTSAELGTAAASASPIAEPKPVAPPPPPAATALPRPTDKDVKASETKKIPPAATASGRRVQGSASCGAGTCAATK